MKNGSPIRFKLMFFNLFCLFLLSKAHCHILFHLIDAYVFDFEFFYQNSLHGVAVIHWFEEMNLGLA